MKATGWLGCLMLSLILLSGCDVLQSRDVGVLPTVVLDSPGRVSPPGTAGTPVPASGATVATASGKVMPASQVQIAAGQSGRALEVTIKQDDRVTAGQTLVRLAGSERMAAAVQAASLELATALQAVKTLNENTGRALTAAQLRLANAQKALDDAQKRREWRNYQNGSQNQIDTARADYLLAKEALNKAEEGYNAFAANDDSDLNRASALSGLASARRARDKALANLNYLLAMPAKIEVDQVEAELQAARSEVADAQKQVDIFKKGADPDVLALAEERVKNARAQLAASQAALADLEIKAPIAGTIAKLNIHSGESLVMGQVLMILADVDRLTVETTDLSERDVPKISLGQAVTVRIKSLGQSVPGKVTFISPLPDLLGGDVVYGTTVSLDTIPAGLRAGMSVDVDFAGR